MLSERLKQLRHENNLLQKEMAQKLKITTSAYGFYEQGKRTPDADTLNKIADYFNVSLDYLLGRSDIRNPYINLQNNTKESITEDGKSFTEEIEDLSSESKKELENYIKLLKLKDSIDANKDEQSATLGQDVC